MPHLRRVEIVPRRRGSLMVVAIWLGIAAASASGQVSPEARRELLEFSKAFSEKRYDEALDHGKKAVDLARAYKPTCDDYVNEAASYINDDNPKEALKVLDKALEVDRKSAQAHYARGVALRQLRQNQMALQSLKEALGLKPDHEGAMREMWGLLNGLREYQVAVAEFEALAKKSPANVLLLYYQGQAYGRAGDFERAINVLGRAAALSPDQTGIHNEYKNALVRDAGLEAAIQAYKDLAAKQPAPLVLLTLAELYVDAEKIDEAVPLLEQLSRAEKIDTNLRMNLAESLEKTARYAQAVEQIRRVLPSLEPKSHEHLTTTFDLGRMLVKAGRLEDGIARLHEAEKLYRETRVDLPLPVLFQLGNAYHKAGNRPRAEEYFREYQRGLERIVGGGDDQETLENLADIYLADGNYRAAAGMLQRALRVAEEDLRVPDKAGKQRQKMVKLGQLRLKLARTHFQGGSPRDCITQAEKVVGDADLGDEARLLLADAYLSNNQPNQALLELRALKGPKATDNKALTLRGRALLAAGGPQAEEALKYIEQAYKAQPDDEALTLLYAQVLSLVGRYDEARGHFGHALEANPGAVQGHIGLGNLEVLQAKTLAAAARVELLRRATEHYKEAFALRPSEEVLAKRSDAERELARAEAEARAEADRLRTRLWAGGSVFVILVTLAIFGYLFWRFSRKMAGLRCLGRILELEKELAQVIRSEAEAIWKGAWQERLCQGLDPGRVNYKQLRDKAVKANAADFLAIANFGHLVAVADACWEKLGFDRRCLVGLADTKIKALIVSNLTYVVECRNWMAHIEKLLDLTGKRGAGDSETKGLGAAVLESHIRREANRCLNTIRDNINLDPAARKTAPSDEATTAITAEPWDDLGGAARLILPN